MHALCMYVSMWFYVGPFKSTCFSFFCFLLKFQVIAYFLLTFFVHSDRFGVSSLAFVFVCVCTFLYLTNLHIIIGGCGRFIGGIIGVCCCCGIAMDDR